MKFTIGGQTVPLFSGTIKYGSDVDPKTGCLLYLLKQLGAASTIDSVIIERGKGEIIYSVRVYHCEVNAK